MFELPLPGVHVWRLRVRFTHPEPPLDWAARVHSRLGPALHGRACALACGAGRCRLGSGCAFYRCYDGEGTRSFRFDCSELDHQPVDAEDQLVGEAPPIAASSATSVEAGCATIEYEQASGGQETHPLSPIKFLFSNSSHSENRPLVRKGIHCSV